MVRLRLLALGLVGAILSVGVMGHGQDDNSRRGRKYKAPPPTSRIEVVVTRNSNGKPISNAAVIFRATKSGKDDGNLEIKTDPDGKANLDVITTGSKVLVQVIADGYATFAEEYQVDEASREIHVALLRPREQLSAYQDNDGKASTRQAGVQEPDVTHKQPAPPSGLVPRAATSGQGTSTSGSSSGTGSQTGEQGTKSSQSTSDSQGPSTKPTPDKTQSAPQP